MNLKLLTLSAILGSFLSLGLLVGCAPPATEPPAEEAPAEEAPAEEAPAEEAH